jgi:hypothetical protein
MASRLTDGARDGTKARDAFVYGISVASIESALSHVTSAPPNGAARRSSSPLTTFFSYSTRQRVSCRYVLRLHPRSTTLRRRKES